MYKVIIKCDGEIDVIMETDKMTLREVYKSALADIKDLWSVEKAGRYDAYVYKDGELLFLLALSARYYSNSYWRGLTRACDLKTCVMHE